MEASKRIVLDTTFIIRLLRGQLEESDLIAKLQETSAIATTIVNAFEIYYGAYKSKNVSRNLSAAKGFLRSLDVLDLDDSSAERAGQVMANLESKGIALDPRDVFTGCIALENGYAILTLNSKHFE
ncbi:MAG: type II toxin-antitoxin system VapC family toxin, partial [Nitrososphaerales archaeon]